MVVAHGLKQRITACGKAVDFNIYVRPRIGQPRAAVVKRISDAAGTVPSDDLLRIEATARVFGRTGVEMEALTAVSVAALTVYDMCKAVDRGMTVERIRLEEKTGGRSGTFRRDE